jgi:AraC family transcriptional activator of pobA
MPDAPLPVFHIQDFDLPQQKATDFYLSTFEEHLSRHTFIQKPHKHDFYIVLLISNGSGTHTIDFVTYEVKPGAVFFLRPGQVHAWQLSGNCSGYILFFSTDFYLLGFPQKKLLHYPFFNPLLQPVIYLAEEAANSIFSLFHELAEEHQNRKWRHTDVLRNLTDNLLIFCTRYYQQQHQAVLPTTGHYHILQQLEELIELHFREHKPVSFYAEKLHLTLRQLNDNCRQSLGKTTSELIQERVILEARRLLLHSGLTITQIGAELGYFDNSYFSRFYRKNTGESPEQFRTAQR